MVNLPTPFLFESGKPAVLLLHTFAGTTTDVRVLGRQFQKAGFTVSGPQFSGHGTTDPLAIFESGGPATWWQDTEAAIDQLVKTGHSQIAVFGESLGGLFALKALTNRSEVIAGGTISTPLFPVDTSRVAARFLKDAKAWYRTEKLTDAMVTTKMAALETQIEPMLTEIGAYTVPIHAGLANLSKPVFIAQSGADELIDTDVGERLAEELAVHTRVVYRNYPGAPHVMTYSPQAKRLATDLLEFSTQAFESLL